MSPPTKCMARSAPTAFSSRTRRISPNSPYAASKAASDHFVRAWGHTYGLPVVVSNCSNNYGPYHFPEKLIPLVILNGLEGRAIPGLRQGRECPRLALCRGSRARPGADRANAAKPARPIISAPTTSAPTSRWCAPSANCSTRARRTRRIGPREKLITFVGDRPGHDLRYAIDASKLQRELGWQPQESLESGLQKTVQWFIANDAWWRPIRKTVYAGERLGIKA